MTAVYRWAGDLVLAALVTLVAAGAVLVLGVSGFPRIVLLLPVVLFVPGYAFLAVLFPDRYAPSRTLRALDRAQVVDPTGREYFQIGTGERAVLSVALSLAIVPLVLLGLNFTPSGISAVPLLYVLTGFTLMCLAVAMARRAWLDPADRYHAFEELGASAEGALGGGGVYSLALAASLLLLAGTGAYAIASPIDSDPLTEYYLVTEQDGNFTNENAAEAVRNGGTVHVAIGNHEGEETTYTTVVRLERVNPDGSVAEASELDRFSTTVREGQTKRVPYDVSASADGERTRVAFLLFKGDPGEATRDDAYRTVHVWLTPPDGQQSQSREAVSSPAEART
ncbi:DUF1616 domain-containing protein [Halegenticoccus soli]|uniref:DUF1616 domain-containing protein n=1 Tax=Halegenticoccus soli TaxID=1985678 RepID=UPI000C6E7C78|nr:DUF1616 domain-containing protein [Halegenticoccus soli]